MVSNWIEKLGIICLDICLGFPHILLAHWSECCIVQFYSATHQAF